MYVFRLKTSFSLKNQNITLFDNKKIKTKKSLIRRIRPIKLRNTTKRSQKKKLNITLKNKFLKFFLLKKNFKNIETKQGLFFINNKVPRLLTLFFRYSYYFRNHKKLIYYFNLQIKKNFKKINKIKKFFFFRSILTNNLWKKNKLIFFIKKRRKFTKKKLRPRLSPYFRFRFRARSRFYHRSRSRSRLHLSSVFRFRFRYSRLLKLKIRQKNSFKYVKLKKKNINKKYLYLHFFFKKKTHSFLKFGLKKKIKNLNTRSFFLFKKNYYFFTNSFVLKNKILLDRFFFLIRCFYLSFCFTTPTAFSMINTFSSITDPYKIDNFLSFFFFYTENNFTFFTKPLKQKKTESAVQKNKYWQFLNLLTFPNYSKIFIKLSKFKLIIDSFFLASFSTSNENKQKNISNFFESIEDKFFFLNLYKILSTKKNNFNAFFNLSKLTFFYSCHVKNSRTLFKLFSFFNKKKINFLLKKNKKQTNLFYYKNNCKNIIKKTEKKKNIFFKNFSFFFNFKSNFSFSTFLNFSSKFKFFYSLNLDNLIFFFNNPLFCKSYNYFKNQFFSNTSYLSACYQFLKKKLNTWTNLFTDSSIFSFNITRQILQNVDYRKIQAVFSHFPYETVVKFIEYSMGRKVAIKIDPFVLKSISVEDNTRCFMWSHKIKIFRKNLGPRLFLVESLQIITLCLRLKDPYVLSNWMLSMFYKISFWKYKMLFRYMQYILRNFFWPYFPDYGIKGLRFQLKGKVSVAGNARKRTVATRIGSLSHATYNYKVLTNLNLLRTFTGVIGFKTWMVF